MEKVAVIIEWVDSRGINWWEYLDEIEPLKPHVCYSVGFIMEDNPEYKTIALGLSKTQVIGRLTIPIGCIKNIKRLVLPKRMRQDET